MKHFITGLTFLAFMLTPAVAQTPYKPADAQMLQSCLETAQEINADDINADDATQQHASTRDCIGIVTAACQEEAAENQTTIGMVMCTDREISWWDDQLNTRYVALQDALGTEEFDKLRTAQRTWLAYRDAQCEFDYFYWRDGTIRSVFGVSCQLQMTAERTLALGEILEWTSF